MALGDIGVLDKGWTISRVRLSPAVLRIADNFVNDHRFWGVIP